MKLSKIAILFAALTFVACDDNTDTIGQSLISNLDNLDVSTDTFTVSTRSILADSVLSRNTIGYLGTVRDPETGTYVKSDFMTQFHTLENYQFPAADRIVSRDNGEIVADSCELILFYDTFYGDSLTPMRISVNEMSVPMKEANNYYSNFDPMKEGLVRKDGIALNKVYTLSDRTKTDAERKSSSYSKHIEVKLDQPYTDKNGKKYSNYGSYVMQKYYEDPTFFKNSIRFINNVVPGFYIQSTGGMGSMAYIYNSQLNVHFRYTEADTATVGMASFAGTEEVLLASNVTNDKERLQQLADDNSCTYLKTPAGIFTEVTLPVNEIYSGHDNDSINSAKIYFTRINDYTESNFNFPYPQTLLMVPKDSLYSFFAKSEITNNRTTYLATYSSTNNRYTFNNISSLIKEMRQKQQKGTASADWNKVVLVPVTTTYSSTSSSNSYSYYYYYYGYSNTSSNNVLTKIVHDMSLGGTRLVGGSQSLHGQPMISVVYSKFK